MHTNWDCLAYRDGQCEAARHPALKQAIVTLKQATRPLALCLFQPVCTLERGQ